MTDLPRTQALRCFITVAREGTVSRAAAVLHLTQPAVSLQLKGLEESTGLQLFNRTPGGFTLTEAGAALLPLAHKAVSATADFRTLAGSLRQSPRGTLRIGTILDPETIRLGPFVRNLATALKTTEVFLRYGMSDDILAQIGRNELDVGYCTDARPTASPRLAMPSERTIENGKFQLMPLTCDLSFVCLASRGHEPMISQAFQAMRSVWDLRPADTVLAPIATERSTKSARR